jgi:hypothetical protein
MSGAREGGVRPRLDEHIVQDETREEMVRGRKVMALPANPPHADRHSQIDYAIRAHTAPGYIAAVELLTRVSQDSDFAADLSVRREGIDPATQTRYLEELAFEVVSTQSLRDITERAQDLCGRGVRRVIAIFVKKGEVCEWSVHERRWVHLPIDGTLEDPTLIRPLAIRALLEAAAADDEVAAALLAKNPPRIAQHTATVRAEGRAEGWQEGLERGRVEGQIEAACELLGISLGPSEHAQIRELDVSGLESLLERIKQDSLWPT